MSNAASTNGWDTVSAIPQGYANIAIKQQKSSPPSFTGVYEDFGTNYTVAGDFGDWMLWGGTGTDVNMKLPFTSGTVKPAPGNLSGKFGSGHAVVTVKLNFLPEPNGGNGQKQNLLTKTTTDNPNDDPVVVIVSVVMDNSGDSEYGQAVTAGMKAWLNSHLQEFNHVFSVANIGAQADKAAFQWIKPTYVAYATEGPRNTEPTEQNLDQWVFGVLAMTEKRPAPKASQVSPYAIPSGANGGFLISQERFINKIFMPGIDQHFVDATMADFDTANNDTTITNVAELKLSPLDIPNADPNPVTDATIGTGGFQINALEQHIEMKMDSMTFTWKEGFIVHLGYTGTSTLTMDKNNHLQMPESGKPTLNYIVTKTSSEQWKELIEGVVLSVAGALVGGLLGGALGGAADAAETAAVDGATDAAANAGGDALQGVMDGIDSSEADNLGDLVADGEADAAESLDNPSRLTKFTNFFRSNWAKILGSTLGGMVGATISQIPNILNYYSEKDLKNIPSLNDFATEAVAPVTWANTKSFKMVSLQLNESMQIGLDITYDS